MGTCPIDSRRNLTAWRTYVPVNRTRSFGTPSREFKSGTNTSALRRKWPRVIKRELVRTAGRWVSPAAGHSYAAVTLPAHLNADFDTNGV
jgi:hypothetical protein